MISGFKLNKSFNHGQRCWIGCGISAANFSKNSFHFGNGAELPALLRDCTPIRSKIVTTFYGHDVTRYPKLRGPGCYAELFERGDWFLALSR